MTATPPRHFLNLDDFDATTLRGMLSQAVELKDRLKQGDRPLLLKDKVLAMIFERQSTRTRVSFDVGMRQLGGETIFLTGQEMQLSREETLADTAKVMSRYVDAIMIRILTHQDLLDLAEAATVPVINGLTRRAHPCQVMADVMTFEEHRGSIKGAKVAWVGDSNNVLASWVNAAELFGAELTIGARGICPGKRPARRHQEGRCGRQADRGSAGSGARRRPDHHRHLGLDGRYRCRRAPPGLETLPGEYPIDGLGRQGCAVHALPSGPSRRRGDRRGHRRAAIGGL